MTNVLPISFLLFSSSPLVFLCRHCALRCHDNTDAGLFPGVHHLGHCRWCTWHPWQPRVTADSLCLGDHGGGTLLLLCLLSTGSSALRNQVVSVSVCVATKSCDSEYDILFWTFSPTGIPSSIFSTQLGLWYGSDRSQPSCNRFPPPLYLALFPGLPTVQFFITCNIQKWRGKTWSILSHGWHQRLPR